MKMAFFDPALLYDSDLSSLINHFSQKFAHMVQNELLCIKRNNNIDLNNHLSFNKNNLKYFFFVKHDYYFTVLIYSEEIYYNFKIPLGM